MESFHSALKEMVSTMAMMETTWKFPDDRQGPFKTLSKEARIMVSDKASDRLKDRVFEEAQVARRDAVALVEEKLDAPGVLAERLVEDYITQEMLKAGADR